MVNFSQNWFSVASLSSVHPRHSPSIFLNGSLQQCPSIELAALGSVPTTHCHESNHLVAINNILITFMVSLGDKSDSVTIRKYTKVKNAKLILLNSSPTMLIAKT